MLPSAPAAHWFRSGREIFPAMLDAIAGAQKSVRLESYIFADDHLGRLFREKLVQAARQGAKVQVLADAFGSLTLSADFFEPLAGAGGEVRFFNPLRFSRFGVRDHRKLLVCDGKTIFVGGANIADCYDGDGVTQGWFDLMVGFEDEQLGLQLEKDFDHLFSAADFQQYPLPRFRAFRHLRFRQASQTGLFAVRPGRGAGIFQRALQRDLTGATSADFIVPYFLPNRALRKRLRQIVRRGGRARLILPAHCDVPVARLAGMVYYQRLLRAGVEIYEYQPQILHAKLFIVDDKVYAGSSNLDVRSFKLNYELMLRFAESATVARAKEIFTETLAHSRRIELKEFRRSLNFWQRWKNHWSHFLLARVDPLVALRQIQSR
jgi:cardiolipin synthase